MPKHLTILCFLILFSNNFCWSQIDAQSYFDTGIKNIKSKNYIAAIGDFTSAVSAKPSFGDAYFQRAKAKILFDLENNAIPSECCADLIAAHKLGNKEASDYMEKYCLEECFDKHLAFAEPELVFCGDFSGKMLMEVPLKTPELINVVRLNVANNKLAKISEKLTVLTTLIWLDLSDNQISEISPTIAKLTSLKELNLNKNKLQNLPFEVGNLKELKYLYLRCNQIKELPKSVALLKSLEVLDLSLNQLTTIPIEIANLKKLKTLNLVGNNIPINKQLIISKLLPNTKINFE